MRFPKQWQVRVAVSQSGAFLSLSLSWVPLELPQCLGLPLAVAQPQSQAVGHAICPRLQLAAASPQGKTLPTRRCPLGPIPRVQAPAHESQAPLLAPPSALSSRRLAAQRQCLLGS